MPAGRPKSIDDSKVFDVAKPGKAKPLGTSRPVINSGPTVTDPTVLSTELTATTQAPSVSRKIIKPISVTALDDTSSDESEPIIPQEPVADAPSSIVILDEPKKSTKKAEKLEKPIDTEESELPTAPEVVEEISAEPITEETSEITDLEPQEPPEVISKTESQESSEITDDSEEQPSEPAEDTQTEEEVPAPQEKLLKPKRELKLTPPSENTAAKADAQVEELKPVAPADNTDNQNDTSEAKPTEEIPADPLQSGSASAEVDALAEASAKTKEEQKESEEQAKRNAALQELIDSKKYFVPLAHDATQKKSHTGVWVMLLVLLTLVAGAYLAIDAKLLKVGIDLPFHIFPQ